jgi:hypothetical protein
MRMAWMLGLLCWSAALAAHVRADEKTHRAAVTELCAVMQLERMLQESTSKMMEIQMQQLPGMQKARPQLDKFFAKYLSWAALKDDFIMLYMQTFSEPEVRELIAFYKTPTGRKAVQQMPVLFELMKSAAAGGGMSTGQPLENPPAQARPKSAPPAATRATPATPH